MTALTVIGCVLGVIIVYLAAIIFLPIMRLPAQPLDRMAEEPGSQPPNRQTVEYEVDGVTVRSWLYLVEGADGPVPGVVLCNGFGGTKDMILESYALRFTAAGFAVLALEYRHYGESDGSPRNAFSFRAQEADLAATVAYLCGRPEIDANKIVIWGTSAGAVHGVNYAADDHGIAGVVAQCPGLDHKKDGNLVFKREGIGYMLGLIAHAQRDKGRSRFGLSPHTIPLVGKPGTMAMLNAPGAFEGYGRIVSPSSSFANELCARIMLMPHGGNPMKKSKDVQCPVLLCVCENDELVAQGSHDKVMEILGDKARVITYPIGHFDIYRGQWFEKAVAAQIDFIREVTG